MKMTDKELVQAWIDHFQSGSEEYSEAHAQMWDAVHDEPERAWRLIQSILQQDKSDEIMACLAAGPLEDLLVGHGAEFIDRVEDLAKSNADFNMLLGGVWKNDIPGDVWNRVTAIRSKTW